MKMLLTKMALASSVALVALFSTEAAYAQKYRAAPRSYDAADHSRARDRRFTDEEQRIIDTITRNNWNNGR